MIRPLNNEEFEKFYSRTKERVALYEDKNLKRCVIIARITTPLKSGGEKCFTESQLKKLFDLAEEEEKKHGKTN